MRSLFSKSLRQLSHPLQTGGYLAKLGPKFGAVALVLLGLGLASAMPLGIVPLDRILQGWLFDLRGSLGWDDRLVVVQIDDRSLAQLGWFPWRRNRYGELLDRIRQDNRNLVVFDLLFSESTPEDVTFAAAMKRHGSVILSQAWQPDWQPLRPARLLDQQAIAIGHIAKLTPQKSQFSWSFSDPGLHDSLGLFHPVNQVPSLAVMVARTYPLITPDRITDPEQSDLSIEASAQLNWPGTIGQLHHYSAVDVLADQVPKGTFQNRIVLVGITATGFDPIVTPFDQSSNAAGVHALAAAIDNLLNDRSLKVFPHSRLLLLVWIGVVLLGWYRFRRSMVGQIWVGSTAFCLWVSLVWLAFLNAYLLPIFTPILLFTVFGLAAFVWDRTQLLLANQQLHNQVILDEVTQIRNRRFFTTYFTQVWHQNLRSQQSFCLVLCDIDYFKAYNDSYGHPAGDRCLYQIAQTLHNHLSRAGDVVARYGGEEFAIILPNTNLRGARCVVEGLQAAIALLRIPHQGSQVADHITLSLGVASLDLTQGLPLPVPSIAAIIDAADRALYDAKKQGRDRYCVASF